MIKFEMLSPRSKEAIQGEIKSKNRRLGHKAKQFVHGSKQSTYCSCHPGKKHCSKPVKPRVKKAAPYSKKIPVIKV